MDPGAGLGAVQAEGDLGGLEPGVNKGKAERAWRKGRVARPGVWARGAPGRALPSNIPVVGAAGGHEPWSDRL